MRNCARTMLLTTSAMGSTFFLLCGTAAAAEAGYQFNIPPEPLGKALTDFSRVSSQQIVFSEDVTAGKRTSGLSGHYTAVDALTALLTGTDLVAQSNGAGVIMVQKKIQTAQIEQPVQPSQPQDGVEEVTVTGFAASLQKAAEAKRSATNFTDSVFAEDIGKFPDNNLAEAINRIPGIQLSRSIAGEGVNISIRGLGASFTQVLLNGNQISIATDTGGSNRAVDMDMFPVELFSKLTVSKTPVAHTTEGGVAGSVNIVNARPFDNPETGFHLAYSFQDGYAESGGSFSPRGAIIASQNWDNKFGVLVGVAAQHFKYRVDGYENIGTDIVGIVDQQAALGQPICPASICALNTTASKNFHWASVVPPGISAANAAAYGLGAAGTPYSYAGPGFTTPGGTSGLSIQDLSNSIWPHLPRLDWRSGFNDRLSVLAALEYRPTENLHFNLDMLWEHSKKFQHLVDAQQFNRQSCNLLGTNGPTTNGVGGDNCQVPVNVKLDANNIVTSATILNSSYFLDNTENTDRVEFIDINPSVEWRINDWARINGSAYFDSSHMDRDMISLMFQTTPGSGIVTSYTQVPGADFPTVQTNAPLNNANGGWQWYITRAQPVFRTTVTKGTHWDATFGGENTNVRIGYAYDEQYRSVINYGATQNMGNCIAIGSTASAPCTLPDGSAEPVGTAALIPNSAIPQYLIPGPANFLGLSGQPTGAYGSFLMGDLTKLIHDSKVQQFEVNHAIVPVSAGGGTFDEKNNGFYIEANGITQFLERDLRFNAGVRYVNTAQTLTAPLFLAGGVQQALTKRTYDAVLPSLNLSVEVMDNMIFRMSGARTMTRANPQFMLPGSSFPTASLSPLNAGNPDLQPYFSDNVDLGLEYYTGGPGVIAINGFSKDISNFTAASSRQAAFGSLGIPTSALTPTQLAEYNGNGQGNDVITVNSQINLQQKLHIRGFEVQLVQPLDFLWDGLGVTANYTRVQQNVDPGLTASVAQSVATGIAPYAYNLGAYYDAHGLSVHVTYNITGRFVSISTPAYSGIPQAQYFDTYRQVDLSSSYTLPWFNGTLLEGAQITFDAINLNNEKQFSYVGDRNAVVNVGYPGPTYLLGFRGKF
jgi:TonB-dependent receptor